MPVIAVREARRVIGSALAAFKGHSVHLRFFAYPHASGRLCLVCVERPDGTDVLQVLAELDGPIPVIDDEHAIERQFFAAPDGALADLMRGAFLHGAYADYRNDDKHINGHAN